MSGAFIRLLFRSTILLLAILHTGTTWGQEETKTPEKEAEPVELPKPIPLSTLSEESSRVLSNIQNEYSPAIQKNVVHTYSEFYDSAASQFESVKEITNYAFEENFPTEVKKSFVAEWNSFLDEISGPVTTLGEHVTHLEQIKNNIQLSKQRWELTREGITTDDGSLEQSVNRINLLIARLDSVSKIASDSLDKAISLQDKYADLILQATHIQAEQRELLGIEIGGLISKRINYIWNAKDDEQTNMKIGQGKEFYNEYNRNEAITYFQTFNQRVISYVVLTIFFYLLILWMRVKVEEIKSLDENIQRTGHMIFKRPVFAAIFLSSIIAISIFRTAPLYIEVSFTLIIIISFAFLIPVIVHRHFRPHLFVFSIIFFMVTLQAVYLSTSRNLRFLELMQSVTLFGFFIWFRMARNSFTEITQSNKLVLDLLKVIMKPFIFLAGVAILGNILGYVHLSYVINHTLILSYYIAVVFGVVYASLVTIMVIFLNTTVAEKSHLLSTYKDYLIKRATVIFQILFIYFWLRFTLDSLYLLEPVKEWLVAFLETGVTVEDNLISIGSLLQFFLVLVVAWMIGNFIRLLIQDELLSRFKLARGVPMAIASSTYYVLITIGFLLALVQLGFNLTQLGVVAGALGIGIGFGLQNVVGNFISGLILIFERPIAIGDIVNLQDIEGEVLSIGIRSSKVREYDGSVMIVPNSDLISNKVINYSITGQSRRFSLPIYTNFKVDPETVLSIINHTVGEVEGVLTYPAPKAFFIGTEDQSKVFRLNFWIKMDNMLQLKSDVAVQVHKSLKENGIEVRTLRAIELSKADESLQKAFETPGNPDVGPGENPGTAEDSEP